MNKQEALANKTKIAEDLANGAVFIYPTDTIYGIGCDATNPIAVKKIRTIKERDTKPFSIIAPSIEWVQQNCKLSEKAKAWLLKLPGPYTLIFPLKNPKAVCAETNRGLNTIGVRIPAHWIMEIVKTFNKPIVTTSVNKTGKLPATSREQFTQFNVDFVIYEGELSNKPSTVIDTVSGMVKR